MEKNYMYAVMCGIENAEQSLRNHLIVLLIERGTLPKEALIAILKAFYADGLWWVPALGQMEKEARNPRFKQALLDNYNCEIGNSGNIAHLKLMENFASSIMLPIDMKDSLYMKALKRAQSENKMLKKATEPTRAGFMLATETLFPILLKLIRPAIMQYYPSADMAYIDEHITVDGDEHSLWMRQSVEQILGSDRTIFEEINKGIREAVHGAFFPLECAVDFVPDPEFVNNKN